MKNENESLPGNFLSQMGCSPCETRPGLNPTGICFSMPSEIADGTYWYYEKEGLFAIGIMDITLKEDTIMEFQQPEYISLDYWETISAEELSPYKRISANTMRGHVSNGELFRARYHKNIPIRGIEIMMMPGYYKDYLNEKYPGVFPDPEKAFQSIDGITHFPEMVMLFSQIRNYKGTGLAAEMFYESKISEALSLIIEKSKASMKDEDKFPLNKDDMENLDSVKSWIEDHAAFDIRTENLTSIACMGQTKLRTSFKRTYG